MDNNAIINLLIAIFPTMSMGLAATISYILVFAIGLLAGIPTVTLYIRKYLPQIIAFLAYVYEQTSKANKLTDVDSKGISIPLIGAEKKDIVTIEMNKALLDPANGIVTKKNISLFQKLSGTAKTIGSVIEFVVPIMKTVKPIIKGK